jgi:hypothetical protein
MHRVSVHDHRVRLIINLIGFMTTSLNRLSLCRIKCLLFALIRKFEFGLVVPAKDIVWRNQAVVRRPFVKRAEQEGQKLPLYVKVHVPDA